MKSPSIPGLKFGSQAVLFGGCLLAALLFCGSLPRATAQSPQSNAEKKGPPETAVTNAPPPAAQPEAARKEAGTPTPAEAPAMPGVEKGPAGTNSENQAKSNPEANSDEIQLSFQGANIDMVIQWLAQKTGKSVVKHPKAQCQLTITASKKVPLREAVALIYRALALEGFTAIETSQSILIVPEGQEPKMSPELVGPLQKDIPQGRQRLVKIFPLSHIQAGELRERVRGVLSDKATIDTDERANRLVVTDYNDNLRLLAELIKEFDVPSASDSVIEIYPLKYAEAENLANLIGLILNPQTAGSGSAGKSSSGGASSPPGVSARSSGGPPMPGGGPPMPGGGPLPSGGDVPPSGGSSASTSPQSIRLWADKIANRLIVSAPKSRLPELERLLKVLDTDKPEDMAVRVITLKNVNATELVKEIGQLYQKMSGKSLKDTIEVAANERSNSLIVMSSEANFKAIEKLVATLDTEDAQEKVIQTFLLKHADAQDVAKQLQELGRDQDSVSRYPYYFSSSMASGRSPKKMSVVADRRRNSLVVQAPPGQMDGIAKMIQELDEPVSDDSLAPKIYHLKYVSAVDIEDILNELFLKKQPQRNYFSFFDDYQEPTADRDVGRLYGKVRITSEPYSNTLIITSNSKENLTAVEDVLKQLDAPSENGESTLRVGLKYADAATVANSINILFAKNGSPPLRPVAQPAQANAAAPQPAQSAGSSQSNFELGRETKEDGYYPWLGGQPDNTRTSDGRTAARPVSDLVGRVRAVADQRGNALLVSANVHYFPQVMKLIEGLDAPSAQVLIEARLVEVASDFLDKLGVRWSPDGSKVFTADDYDNSILAHASNKNQKGYGGTTTVNTPATLPTGLASLRSGVLDASVSMDFLIQFLRKNTDATILAEPQINIRDNETGKLFVGQRVPTLTAQNNPALGGTSQSFVYMDVGVILEVTPHINISGDVELKIHAESSTVVPGQTVLGGVVVDTRNFRTDLRAKSGQTLVLGGIIQKQMSEIIRKTPILGSIPGLGWAFKKKDKTTREVELMVFLRPKVVRTSEEAQELSEEVDQRTPLLKKWNEEAHSPKKAGVSLGSPIKK